MNNEQNPAPSNEPESREFYVANVADIAPIAGLKRWLKRRRENRSRKYDEAETTMSQLHSDRSSNGDRFYYGPKEAKEGFQPEPLGIFAAESVASALSYARQLQRDVDIEVLAFKDFPNPMYEVKAAEVPGFVGTEELRQDLQEARAKSADKLDE